MPLMVEAKTERTWANKPSGWWAHKVLAWPAYQRLPTGVPGGTVNSCKQSAVSPHSQRLFVARPLAPIPVILSVIGPLLDWSSGPPQPETPCKTVQAVC